MRELELSEAQRNVLNKHRETALEKEKLLKWIEELLAHKRANIASLENNIKQAQKELDQTKASLAEMDTYKMVTVKNTNEELQKILTSIVEELKLGPMPKIQLSFEAGIPRLFVPS